MRVRHEGLHHLFYIALSSVGSAVISVSILYMYMIMTSRYLVHTSFKNHEIC